MRVLICDDDPIILNSLMSCVKKFFSAKRMENVEIVGYSESKGIIEDTGNKDIVFLDIEMPGMNGIYVGKKIKENCMDALIFVVTSFGEYLDDAMRISVFRFLTKPIDKDRLYRNLEDALEVYNNRNKTIPVDTKDGIIKLESSSIIMVEAQNRKLLVRTVEKDYQTLQTIQYWKEILPEGCFIQTHRSFFVNLEYVERFDHENIYFSRRNLKAYLTRRKYNEFKRRYLLYLGSVHG